MVAQGFFNRLGLAEDRVFFEDTREAKVGRIGDARCTHFIDDLEEVFLTPGFPDDVRRILFDREGAPSAFGVTSHRNKVTANTTIPETTTGQPPALDVTNASATSNAFAVELPSTRMASRPDESSSSRTTAAPLTGSEAASRRARQRPSENRDVSASAKTKLASAADTNSAPAM